jgi:hypothetical protein
MLTMIGVLDFPSVLTIALQRVVVQNTLIFLTKLKFKHTSEQQQEKEQKQQHQQ